MKKKIAEQRRYVERLYSIPIVRELFDIPKDEMLLEVSWNRQENKIEVKTLKDFDKKKGDI